MHAFSLDGKRWQWSTVPAYNTTVRMADGSSVRLNRRERPHLLFDADGTPTHLYTAVTGLPGPFQHTDRCWTFVQALGTGAGEE